MQQGVQAVNERVKQESGVIEKIVNEIDKVIVGQKYMVERLMVGLLADGHILLEGVPGLAKTLSVKTLAQVIATKYQRIQFTPDLLPADLIGTPVYNPKTGDFTTKLGPIFANLILADEINRAPAKVQSALLEAMQEKQVSIGKETHRLEEPFLVLATQNPIELAGTYPLPEAQIDRFMLKVKIEYPNKKEEREILERMAVVGMQPKASQVIDGAEILRLRAIVNDVYIDDKIKDYIVNIVFATREPKAFKLEIGPYIQYGASPRASIYLTLAAKAYAFLKGRGFVTPQDVKSIGMDVLRHRVIVSYEAEAEEMTSEDLIQKVFDNVEVP